jgi:uncharacterized membrane protein
VSEAVLLAYAHLTVGLPEEALRRDAFEFQCWAETVKAVSNEKIGLGAMSLYLVLKFVHVVLAIAAVGANATYGVWLALGAREPQHLRVALRGIQFLDRRVANPAYGLLLLTGLALLAVGQLSVRTPWIASALILFVLAVVLGVVGYSPALQRQVRAVEEEGPTSGTYRNAASSAQTWGLAFMVLVLALVFDMVTKPVLW